MLGELLEAAFDKRICLVRQRADQSRLLTAKVLIHSSPAPETRPVGSFYVGGAGRSMAGITIVRRNRIPHEVRSRSHVADAIVMWRRYCDALNLISPNAASDVGSISSRYAWRSALARSISDSARIGARLCFAISTRLSRSSHSSRVASMKLPIGLSPKSTTQLGNAFGCSTNAWTRASKEPSQWT
jgi:hypothetical protein